MRGIVATALGVVLLACACGSAPEPTERPLLSLLPTQLDGFALTPHPMDFAQLQQFASGGPETKEALFIALTGANQGNFEGYLVTANQNFVIGAYRVSGASKETLEEGCAALIYTTLDQLTRRDLDGRSVLLRIDNTGGFEAIMSGCYVRNDVAFYTFARSTTVDLFRSLPIE